MSGYAFFLAGAVLGFCIGAVCGVCAMLIWPDDAPLPPLEGETEGEPDE